jgi:hypothetical protein
MIVFAFFYSSEYILCDKEDYGVSEKVKGGYKECIIFSYNYKDFKLDTNSKHISSCINYDNQGRKLEQWLFSGNSIFLVERYKYSEKSDTIEVVSYHVKGIIISKNVFIYDFKGNLKESIYINKNGVDEKNIYKYKENGTIIEKNEYNAEDKIKSKTIYNYDINEKLIEELYYNGNDSIHNKFNILYDDQGNQTRILQPKEKKEPGLKGLIIIIPSKYFYKYDKKSNLIEMSAYENDKLIIKYLYKYDDFGNMIEWNEFNSIIPIDCKNEYIYSK